MAKKSWLDVAKEVATDAAISAFIPGGIIGKVAYVAGKEIYNNLSKDDESSNIDLAVQAYDNDDYEEALEYMEAAHSNDEIRQFHYYRMVGKCHYGMMADYRKEYREKAELLGLSDDTDDDDPRWEKLVPLKNSFEEERSLAYDCLKESLTHREEGDFIADKDNLAEVYWVLTDVCNSIYEQRRYDMAAMASDNFRKDAKAEYKELTKQILEYLFDEGYMGLKKIRSGEDPENWPYDEKLIEILESQLFSNIDYHERQFIYIAKNIDALAGCYDDNIQWLFTIDALPKELQFPVGHPQPNSLYYAHPAKKGVYLPIEGADEELFNDKVRDFQRLAQCLGATEITFRSVKGHSLSENHSKSMNVEVGGEYSGYEGCVNYDNKRSNSSSQSLKGEREMVQRFNPIKAPYVPDDVAWLAVDPEWQSLVKKRLEGNMLHYSVRISSRKTMAVTDSRMDDVKVAFKSFVANAHVNYSQQMERSFQREEETEWEISVSFKPLEELDEAETQQKPETFSTDAISVDEYLNLRLISQIQYYVLSIVNENKSDKVNIDAIAQRIKKDCGLSIPTKLFNKKTKQEVYDALWEVIARQYSDGRKLHNIITTLPKEEFDNKLKLKVFFTENVEELGSAIIGVVTSGSISVGDRIILCTDDDNDEDVEATVTWIELFGKIFREADPRIGADAGDSLGIGVDVDVTSLSPFSIIVKSDERDDDDELTKEEQEYINELKDILADGEISPRERRLLDKIRQKLGITEERAKELEASLTEPQLSEDEREYLDMYREYAEEGEITDKARRRLDKFANALGITDERVKEIEKM